MAPNSVLEFELTLDDLPSLSERYRTCTSAEYRVLHQLAHDSSYFDGDVTNTLSPRYRNALEKLLDGTLVRSDKNDELEVQPDLLYLPEGPGVRRDQLSGVLHRLPKDHVREWSGRLFDEDNSENNVELVYRRVASEVLGDNGSIESELSAGKWIPVREVPPAIPRDRSDFYTDLTETEPPLRGDLIYGRVFPVWNESGALLGLVRADRFGEEDPRIECSASGDGSTEEKDWERSPFDLSEQIKVTQILSDALPVRLTEDDDPHRFDLKEAARITGWPLGHVDYLTRLVVEQELLTPGDDRFFMTDRYESWENGDVELYPFLTTLRLKPDEEAEYEHYLDFGFGRFLRSLLEELDSIDGDFSVEDVRKFPLEHPRGFDVLMSGTVRESSLESMSQKLIENALELLFWLGLLDCWEEDTERRYRLNDRGREIIGDGNVNLAVDEGLPLILQPDGQLMVPLERPVETFRHVNPFGLIVKVDRMIVFQIDDKSLVQALNDGWDAAGFRSYLEANVRDLPTPMAELFDDILEDVENVAIQEVHHLLTFETGATAARAMNILNNYNPSRIDETTVVLASETSHETIRRNLSRGGIRLRTESDQGGHSPLVEL